MKGVNLHAYFKVDSRVRNKETKEKGKNNPSININLHASVSSSLLSLNEEDHRLMGSSQMEKSGSLDIIKEVLEGNDVHETRPVQPEPEEEVVDKLT